MTRVLFGTLLVFLCPSGLFAQTAPATGESAAIQALAAEIRELRLSLERSNLLTLRFQAAMQGNQVHADRVKDLSQQLASVTNELKKVRGDQTSISYEIKTAEGNLNNTDAGTRRSAEERLPHLKAALEAFGLQEAELRSRESALLSNIRRETTLMDDWSRWLQQFEQSIQPGK